MALPRCLLSLNSDCRRREIKGGATLKRDGPPGPVLCRERPRSGAWLQVPGQNRSHMLLALFPSWCRLNMTSRPPRLSQQGCFFLGLLDLCRHCPSSEDRGSLRLHAEGAVHFMSAEQADTSGQISPLWEVPSSPPPQRCGMCANT